MDLQQIKKINELAEPKKQQLTKADIKTIEAQALTRMYNHETFFSLFSELDAIYQVVKNSVKLGALNYQLSIKHQQSFERTLGFVLDRPTPVKMEETSPTDKDNVLARKDQAPSDLSILKQCLLFDDKDQHARVTIYKIAQNLKLYLSNYIDTIEDLELIIQSKIPEQQYRTVINKLEENIITKQINSSIMDKQGEGAQMRVDYQSFKDVAVDNLESEFPSSE